MPPAVVIMPLAVITPLVIIGPRAVIMPLATEEGMRITAQRIRQSVEQMRIPWEGEILRVTISLGGARLSTAQSELDGQRLLETADAKLYKAKENGRNCFLG